MVRLFLCHALCGNFIAPAAETLLIAVEQQLIFLLFRHGYDIILPFHWSHIQYKQQQEQSAVCIEYDSDEMGELYRTRAEKEEI